MQSRIFKDKEKLLEMLSMRRQGFTFSFLARMYKCDRTSLRYQCRKYQIFPEKTVYVRNNQSAEIFNPNKIASRIILKIAPSFRSQWKVIDGERVNLGKSYKEYLKEYKQKEKALSPYKKPEKSLEYNYGYY